MSYTYNSLDESLIAVLAETHLPALPEERRPLDKRPWLRAIVLVDKGISSNYAIAYSDGANARIVKDFGRSAIIKGIKAVYPYVVLNAKYLPKFNNDDEIVRYIADADYASDQSVRDLISTDGKSPEKISADRQIVADMINIVAVRKAMPYISVTQEAAKTQQQIQKKQNITKKQDND